MTSTSGLARVGIDVGGTFTDAVLDDGVHVHVAKVRSTARDAAVGCLAALDELLRRSGRTAPELAAAPVDFPTGAARLSVVPGAGGDGVSPNHQRTPSTA
jgi:hypothetical protein